MGNKPTQQATTAGAPTPEPTSAPEPTAPAMPQGYGEPTFATPERSEPARGGGILVARVTLPVPVVGLVIDAGVWRNPAKGNEPEYVSVSLPRYVRALDPIEGRDNATTGDVKDAILARWLEWRKGASAETATAGTKRNVRGRLVMPTA